MTSSIPSPVAYLQAAILILVLIARYKWYNKKPEERILNVTLVLMLIIELLMNPKAQHWLHQNFNMHSTTALQLSLCLLSFASGEFLSAASMWAGLPIDEAQSLRKRCWLINIPLISLLLMAGTQSRTEGVTLQESKGIGAIFALCSAYTVITYLCAKLIYFCLEELKKPLTEIKEKAVLVVMIMICAEIFIACPGDVLLQTLDYMNLTHTAPWRVMVLSHTYFFDETGILILAIIPFVNSLIAVLRLDPVSRKYRLLHPMWDSMISAFPELKLPFTAASSSRKTTLLALHRTVIEIRDSFLLLRPYCSYLEQGTKEIFLAHNLVPEPEEKMAALALMLAFALENKNKGKAPSESIFCEIKIPSASLQEEIEHLIIVSKWWIPAQQTASSRLCLDRELHKGKKQLI